MSPAMKFSEFAATHQGPDAQAAYNAYINARVNARAAGFLQTLQTLLNERAA